MDKGPVIPHPIDPQLRAERLGHRALVVWLTGLSGSGKSTLAAMLESELFRQGYLTCRLDGDALRSGLNSDLGFDDQARSENIRRAAEVARLLADAGLVVICSFISPFGKDRNAAAEKIGRDRYLEVFLDCPFETCRQRDVKGLYARAAHGKVDHFTGMSSTYEKPEAPDLVLHTGSLSAEDCMKSLLPTILPRIAHRPDPVPN